jgi:SAM-dependent methyltransferase
MLDCVREALPAWRRFGVELSPSARAEIVARGHTAVRSLEDLPAEQQFDWINIDNVLEHLPDPQGTLIGLRSRLRPNGFVYIDVPNESFFSVRYRLNDLVRGFRKPPTAQGHVNLFTSRTLRRLIAAAGYDCERFWLESVSVPHRLKGALGGDASPRIQTALNLLRITRLDVHLRVAYFLAAIITRRPA